MESGDSIQIAVLSRTCGVTLGLSLGVTLTIPDGHVLDLRPAASRHLMASILFPQSDLLDVNQIIRDLASMVSEQGDAIGEWVRPPPTTCSLPPSPPPRCGLPPR